MRIDSIRRYQFGSRNGDGFGLWWVYPLHSYRDADKDGKVAVQELYDIKAVHLLRIVFDGLDYNGDGMVKLNEARLEGLLRHSFLRNITAELFDYFDLNKDGQLSALDVYNSQCRLDGTGSSFCLAFPSGFPSEGCDHFGQRELCKTLLTSFFSTNLQ